MLAIYKHLLRLYPATHRRHFGEEMLAVFQELQADSTRIGASRQLRFYLRESGGLVIGALAEHWRQFLKRRLSVRNEFRFPKMTWVLMTIILAGVVMAIAKGEAISVSVPPMSPALPPIHPAHGLLSNWGLSFLIMYVIGVTIGGVVFFVRRSVGINASGEKF